MRGKEKFGKKRGLRGESRSGLRDRLGKN